MRRWLNTWRLKRGIRRLWQYLCLALDAPDDPTLTAILDNKVGTLLARLETAGAITQAERIEIGREWVRCFARARLPHAYRQKDAKKVAELGWFLKAG
jgi:hypothetical protein